MTLHKYWNAPVHTAASEYVRNLEIAPIASVAAPAITQVWLAEYDCDGDREHRLFFTQSGCEEWRREIASENWNTGEEKPEDAEEAADAYFEHNEAEESFGYSLQPVR